MREEIKSGQAEMRSTYKKGAVWHIDQFLGNAQNTYMQQ
jgi:hypothetical protein